eukprot:2770778-Ditylum_brightwellii.AAC.1
MCEKGGWLNQLLQPTDADCGGGEEVGAMFAHYVVIHVGCQGQGYQVSSWLPPQPQDEWQPYT